MSSSINADRGHAVATRGLSKRYRDEGALDSVDLRVPEGTVYVLVGPNGAGKSTIFKILMNLKRADTGTAEVFGIDALARGPEVRAQVGYVPEHFAAGYGWMKCGRLLQHVSAYYPAWDQAYADRLVRAFELRLDRKAGKLSKGEARRLQLVLALAHRPALLLLDEPAEGLDPFVRKQTMALLAEHLSDTPTTVLMSTHQLGEVESLAGHIGVIGKGRLVAQMPRDLLLRTVRRYLLEVPDDWETPPELQVAAVRRSTAGREGAWTLIGEERDISERLARTGARVREVTSLSLEDAALALLSGGVSR